MPALAPEKPRKFYAGLSLGYAASIGGGITADYADLSNAYETPGSFEKAEFQIGPRVMPIEFSFGLNLKNNLRVDISHMRYSGITLPGRIRTLSYDGWFGLFTASGGDISGNATMLNVSYNLEHLTGRFLTGIISPYVGAGIGFGTNTISDYTVYENSFYMGNYSAPSALHYGGTVNNNLVYMFEVGGTAEMFGTKRWLLDAFVRWTNLGRVKTNGDILLKQTLTLTNADVYDRYEDRAESGNLNVLDVGARLRLLF